MGIRRLGIRRRRSAPVRGILFSLRSAARHARRAIALGARLVADRRQHRALVGHARRRVGIIGRSRFALSDFERAAARGDRNATLRHRYAQSLAWSRCAARIADRLLGNVLGSAHADGGGWRLHPVIVVITFADGAGYRAQCSAQQIEEAALAVRIEAVLVDPEGGAGLQGDDRAVGEADLHAAVRTGADEVAAVDFGTATYRHRGSLRPLNGHVAGRHQGAPVSGYRGLREYGDQQDADACRPRHPRARRRTRSIRMTGKHCDRHGLVQ